RPEIGAWNQLAQGREHLATVADAERERVGAREELREHRACALVIEDRLGPTFARAEHVAVREPAARDPAAITVEAGAARQDVAHVHVVRLEPRAIERRGHLALTVHALLSQHGDFRPAGTRRAAPLVG